MLQNLDKRTRLIIFGIVAVLFSLTVSLCAPIDNGTPLPPVEPTVVVDTTPVPTPTCEELGGYEPIDTGDGIGDGEDTYYPPVPPNTCVIPAD